MTYNSKELETNKEQITEKQAEEMYQEELEETKEMWITNYYGGHVLKEIDPIAYNMGLQEFIAERLSDLGYEILED